MPVDCGPHTWQRPWAQRAMTRGPGRQPGQNGGGCCRAAAELGSDGRETGSICAKGRFRHQVHRQRMCVKVFPGAPARCSEQEGGVLAKRAVPWMHAASGDRHRGSVFMAALTGAAVCVGEVVKAGP